MNSTMLATTIDAVGAPWRLQEVPVPTPAPGQVLVRVHASGICGTDPYITGGQLVFRDLPGVPGHEGVGEVVAVGDGVTSRVPGDRVGIITLQESCGRCAWCRGGRPLDFVTAGQCPGAVLTGFNVDGAQAEYVVAAAAGTVLLPDALAYRDAAPIMCIGYTAWSGIRRADPEPGERIAVAGIGGMGHLALQYARAAGFETIAVTATSDKQEIATRLGADHVVADGAELAAMGGADVLLSTTSSNRAAVDALQGLAPYGRAVMMGIAFDEFNLANMSMIMNQHSILGSAHNGTPYLVEALDLAASGAVTPMVETFEAQDVAAAYERAASGRARFRVVVEYH
ncbi:alcohol dehydrogenase catalytic domain-containing protein [Nocardioides sp. 1609]|uniref:alcohol dehydrogenase catalytic domain-containing protein n=1 Tax=Nocardioides sp. 1609 TaxID=2508327 RepID=UPI001ADBB518|nr:alcohol dehydrogenase catalytic domain-containing protein [Nocardioides sp. 1609]